MKLISSAMIALLFISVWTNPEPKVGPIVLIGGGKIPHQAIEWVKPRSRFDNVYVVTYNFDKSNRWLNLFKSVTLILPKELTEKHLNNIGCLVIDGGDQWNYLNQLDGNIVEKAHRQGVPILSTSAGAMILGEYYFSAEQGTVDSDEAARGERICLGKSFVQIKHLEKTLVDTHYRNRDRQGRLKVFMEKSGADRGIGIDERTALCIDSDGSYYICGEGEVAFVTR